MQNAKGTNRMKTGLYMMALIGIMVLGSAPMLGAASGPGQNWRLMVKSAACVQGPRVLLGEIADPLPGVDARTWATLSKHKLWKASDKRGRPVTVSRDKLHQVLKHYMGTMVNNLVLPSQLTVQTGGKVVDAEELRNRVVAFLTPRAKDLGGEVVFKDLNLPMHFFFDNEYDKLSINLTDTIKPGRNQIQLKAVSSEGKILSSKAGTVFLNVWKAVPVAAKPLNRNERVTKDKVTFMRVNLAYKPELWDGTGGPWRMTRTLGRGQPFTATHLEPVPLIERGEKVTLVYKNDRIQLSIKAEALGEAGMGQQVGVRNLQSKRTVRGTVVGDNMVLVR
ncbi:Flagella basal body P-ring formation protein FlgA [Pseudodesulfovibrio profundus]|uniref:Flagella basal body P-ring formation protein FlgA n=1 Tax=Pseudodesulfovibrio profundus TaxID=57320 RepID=A0A2C8F541_9BACT|nr:flagellar basal body P-ring formation chaperone FlgA [Pseudodesulfovibrio profundus]MBC18024.1 flagella basal body P-ring formation protein FlgA [Desulfovibrio sp.]SOB57626.1 Flagella basal body P-ring formation protein FlgA [Pseudodesulfovibrio profundus]|tara:strand:+ start:4507 stop:5511 length:1005 start_codon:yes stop_codon:yes gene_type:complete